MPISQSAAALPQQATPSAPQASTALGAALPQQATSTMPQASAPTAALPQQATSSMPQASAPTAALPQRATAQATDRQGSGLLQRQGSKEANKARNRPRKTDGLHSQLAEQDVASTSGVPARNTSSGDSARGGQNGAAPQGRAPAKRPNGDLLRASRKSAAALPSKAFGKVSTKAAPDEEEDPPVPSRLDRIAARQAKEKQERLEKGSPNTSGEAARAGSATGLFVREAGAGAGKGQGPSRLGPGRNNSNSLPAEQPGDVEGGKPTRKRALQVGWC